MSGFEEDSSNHDSTVSKVLDKVRSVGMWFNPTKCQFKQTQVKFFGLILTRSGVIPDLVNIEVLKKLPEFKDEKLLQSYLGMVNYLSRFDLNMANMTYNLRALLKKGSYPVWTDVHSLDFQKMMDSLCSKGKILRYYRPDLDL